MKSQALIASLLMRGTTFEDILSSFSGRLFFVQDARGLLRLQGCSQMMSDAKQSLRLGNGRKKTRGASHQWGLNVFSRLKSTRTVLLCYSCTSTRTAPRITRDRLTVDRALVRVLYEYSSRLARAQEVCCALLGLVYVPYSYE